MKRQRILLQLAVLPLLLAAGCSSLAQTPRPAGQVKLLLDCENASIWETANDSPIALCTARRSEGRGALRIGLIHKPEKHPIAFVLTRQVEKDWSRFRYLNADVFLEGKEPATIALWVGDKDLHVGTQNFDIKPGWNTCTVDLDTLPVNKPLDRKVMEGVCFSRVSPAEITVLLDNIYLSAQVPQTRAATPAYTPNFRQILENAAKNWMMLNQWREVE